MTPVDTVIVAYRSEDVIEAAIERARALGGTVVVVDHGDGESAWRAACSGAVAIHDPSNPGFGAGQNHGLAFTTSELVLLCNPDAEIVPAAVKAGIDLLRSRPTVAAVQGTIMNLTTSRPERSAGVELRPVHLLGRAVGARRLLGHRWVTALARRSPTLRDHADRIPAGPMDVEALAATALLVRRAALDSVGGFDESYFLYGEDQDLCHRLRRRGWALVAVPDLWAVHASGGSADSTGSRELNWWRGTMRYASKWWGWAPWAVGMVAAAVRAATLDVPGAWSALVWAPLRDRLGSTRDPGWSI